MDDFSRKTKSNWRLQTRGRVTHEEGTLAGGLYNFLTSAEEKANSMLEGNKQRRHFEPTTGYDREQPGAGKKCEKVFDIPADKPNGPKVFPEKNPLTTHLLTGYPPMTEAEVVQKGRKRAPAASNKSSVFAHNNNNGDGDNSWERGTGRKYIKPVEHNENWDFKIRSTTTKPNFHPEAFPGSIGYDKFPDFTPDGKPIDYSAKQNGGVFSIRMLHRHEPRPAADVPKFHKERIITPPPPIYDPWSNQTKDVEKARALAAENLKLIDHRNQLKATTGTQRVTAFGRRASSLESSSAPPTAPLTVDQQGSLHPSSRWTFVGSFRP